MPLLEFDDAKVRVIESLSHYFAGDTIGSDDDHELSTEIVEYVLEEFRLWGHVLVPTNGQV